MLSIHCGLAGYYKLRTYNKKLLKESIRFKFTLRQKEKVN